MQNKFYSIAIILFILVGGAMAQSKNEAEVNALLQKMTEAQVNFKSENLDKILTSDYIEISPVGEFDTREKVLSFYDPKDSEKAKLIQSPRPYISDQRTRVYKNFAVSIAKITYSMPSADMEKPSVSIRITYVARKEKGVWKICSAHYTGIRPPRQN